MTIKRRRRVEAEDEVSGKGGKMTGFVLEYDAARKIAQGLGAHLESLTALVEVKGDKARLLPVSERTSYLFGQGVSTAAGKGRKKKKEAADHAFRRRRGPGPGGAERAGRRTELTCSRRNSAGPAAPGHAPLLQWPERCPQTVHRRGYRPGSGAVEPGPVALRPLSGRKRGAAVGGGRLDPEEEPGDLKRKNQ